MRQFICDKCGEIGKHDNLSIIRTVELIKIENDPEDRITTQEKSFDLCPDCKSELAAIHMTATIEFLKEMRRR